MSDTAINLRSRSRVNVLKKVKVDGQWKLCAVVVEPGGKLRDRVHVNGHIEVHSEGVYYIEWRENRQRHRQSVSSRYQALERARLKSLELDARKAGIQLEPKLSPQISPPPVARSNADIPAVQSNQVSQTAEVILKGLGCYLQEIISASVHAHLTALGLAPNKPGAESLRSLGSEIEPSAERNQPGNPSLASGASQPSSEGRTLIDSAIKTYLKDIEPPQREQKTYDEYRLVLNKFRDTCGKLYLEEINRDDCLAFMRHLYGIGNEARTVFNRMGIVQQLLKLHGIVGLLKPRDKPKFVANVREMYQPEDLEALFKACSGEEKVLYMFFLLTGERDKEVRYSTWDDVDFRRKCVRVTAKKHLGFKPKDLK